MYVLLSIQASACSLQDFDALEKGYLAAGGDTGTGAAGSAGDGGEPSTAGSGGAPSNGGNGGSGGEPLPEGNLIPNPSFEAGHEGWVPFGMSTILDVTTPEAHSGQKCILSASRSEAYMGPSYPARNLLERGKSYLMTAWLRMVEAPDSVQLTLKSDCSADPQYTAIAAVPVSTEWTKIEGVLRVPDCELVELTPYFEGPAPDANFWVDDVTITPVE